MNENDWVEAFSSLPDWMKGELDSWSAGQPISESATQLGGESANGLGHIVPLVIEGPLAGIPLWFIEEGEVYT